MEVELEQVKNHQKHTCSHPVRAENLKVTSKTREKKGQTERVGHAGLPAQTVGTWEGTTTSITTLSASMPIHIF